VFDSKPVIDLLKELSGEETICEEATLQEDLALDSLSMVTLLVELELLLDTELDEEEMNPFTLKTVADVLALAEKHGGERLG